MTVKEFYEDIRGDYVGVIERMSSDDIVKMFIVKFLGDKNMNMLEAAVENRDVSGAFTYAYALKGLVGNFGFSILYNNLCEYVEELRPQTQMPDEAAFEKIKEQYNFIVEKAKQIN